MKSHVSMEQKQCIVCTKVYDTGAILLDRRLRQSLERNTVTGLGLCDDCQARYDQGYIALVGVDASRSTLSPGGKIKPQDAYRTGDILHIRVSAFTQIFNVSPLDTTRKQLTMMFVSPDVIARLKTLAGE